MNNVVRNYDQRFFLPPLVRVATDLPACFAALPADFAAVVTPPSFRLPSGQSPRF
jgi:hypothetical protein